MLHDKSDGYQFAIKSGLYSFVGMLFRYLKYEKTEKTREESAAVLQDFDMIIRYIKDHFKENIDQSQIGREIGMSRAKIYRVLRTASGTSTTALTNYYRIEYAKHLLKSAGYPIRHIAAECGFDSDSSFYRVFHELTGTSPQEYRKSPIRKTEALGIQGYAKYSVPESLSLLRGYIALKV